MSTTIIDEDPLEPSNSLLSRLYNNTLIRTSVKLFLVIEGIIWFFWLLNAPFYGLVLPLNFHNSMWEVFLRTTTMRAMFVAAMPILVTAVGAAFNERAGVINIGLEGIMLFGGFAAVYMTYVTGNPWMGVLAALLFGLISGLIHAVLTITYRAEQIVVGVAINLLALGITKVLAELIWGSQISPSVESIPTINIFEIPILGIILEYLSISRYVDLPVIGPILSYLPDIILALNNQSALVFIGFLLIPVCHFLLFKSPFGLRIRVIGEHPEAAATAGINVHLYQYLAVLISGVLSGFGGAILTLAVVPNYQAGLVGGRGFIALAAMIFGKWTIFGSAFASIFFGYFFALRIKLAGAVPGFQVPQPFIQMIPYIVTMITLAGFIGDARPPKNIGKPYDPTD